MAKKQTRRSISISLELYQRLEAVASNLPISQIASAGIEAVIRGDVKLEEMEVVERPRSDLGRFRQLRKAAEAVAQIRHDTARIARAAVERGLSTTVVLPVSKRLAEDITVQAERSGVTTGQTLDDAVNRMLDSLAKERCAWCRSCLEAIEHCDCAPQVAR